MLSETVSEGGERSVGVTDSTHKQQAAALSDFVWAARGQQGIAGSGFAVVRALEASAEHMPAFALSLMVKQQAQKPSERK